MEKIRVEYENKESIFIVIFLLASLLFTIYFSYILLDYIKNFLDLLSLWSLKEIIIHIPTFILILFFEFILILTFFGILGRYLRMKYAEEYYIFDEKGITYTTQSSLPISWLNAKKTIPYFLINTIVIKQSSPNSPVGEWYSDHPGWNDIVDVTIYPKKTEAEIIKFLRMIFRGPIYNFTTRMNNIDRIKNEVKDKVYLIIT